MTGIYEKVSASLRMLVCYVSHCQARESLHSNSYKIVPFVLTTYYNKACTFNYKRNRHIQNRTLFQAALTHSNRMRVYIIQEYRSVDHNDFLLSEILIRQFSKANSNI